MKPPKIIRVGPIPYAVREDGHRDAPWGRIDHGKQEITYEPSLSPHVMCETIWHEIVHAIIANMEGNTSDHDEKWVSRWANSILQVMIDNPDMERLHRCLRRINRCAL